MTTPQGTPPTADMVGRDDVPQIMRIHTLTHRMLSYILTDEWRGVIRIALDEGTQRALIASDPITRCLRNSFAEFPDQGVDVDLEDALHSRSGLKSTRTISDLADALYGSGSASESETEVRGAVSVDHHVTTHSAGLEIDCQIELDDLTDPKDLMNQYNHLEAVLTGEFYGYQEINVPQLVANVEGCQPKDWMNPDIDRTLAAEIAGKAVYAATCFSLIDHRTSLWDFNYAHLVLVEATNAPSETHFEAFRKEPKPKPSKGGIEALVEHIRHMNSARGDQTPRFSMIMGAAEIPGVRAGNLPDIQDWVKEGIKTGNWED